MSQNTDNQEPNIAPDSIYDTDTEAKPKPKKKRSKVLLLGGVVIVAAVAYSFMASKDTNVTTTVVKPPELNTTVGGDVQQNSIEYAESLRRANDQNATQALEEGRTFIPAPEGSLTPVNSTVESLPQTIVDETPQESEAVVTRKRPVVAQLRKTTDTAPSQGQAAQPAAQAQGEKPENPYTGMILGHMTTVGKSLMPKEAVSETFKVADKPEPAPVPTKEAATTEPLSVLPSGQNAVTPGFTQEELDARRQAELKTSRQENVLDEPVRENEKVFVAAGDVMYGEVIATVNSDAQMPVLVEVTTGEYKGARLLGTFTTDNVSGKLVVSFSQMTNGNVTVPVSALAVDGYTSDTSVRSGIDRRYLKRYGTVFATTFIEGVASGMAEPEKTVLTDQNGNNQVVEQKRTTEEALWNGVNNALGVVNDDILASRPKGPKIYLHSGYPVGILFVDDLRENPTEDTRTP